MYTVQCIQVYLVTHLVGLPVAPPWSCGAPGRAVACLTEGCGLEWATGGYGASGVVCQEVGSRLGVAVRSGGGEVAGGGVLVGGWAQQLEHVGLVLHPVAGWLRLLGASLACLEEMGLQRACITG